MEQSVSLPMPVLKKYYNPIIHTTFIETGSFKGGGIAMALEAGFSHVISTEIDPKYYYMCKERFSLDQRVELVFGDTCLIMPQVLERVTTPSIFWLDAHYQYEAGIGLEKVPLLTELKAISESSIKDHIIMIDDRRLMGVDFWEPVTEAKVLAALAFINPNYTISYEDTPHGERDIIVAHL
jgi:hypothetical protein